jgi:hypothetical protein
MKRIVALGRRIGKQSIKYFGRCYQWITDRTLAIINLLLSLFLLMKTLASILDLHSRQHVNLLSRL